MSLSWLDEIENTFPDIESALREPNGLLAVGGDLSAERLIAAYRAGIFPWYEQGQPILWWSPDPRMVLLPKELKISSSLRKFIRKQSYRITMDNAFQQVIEACSEARSTSDGTWITQELKSAYYRLHEMSVAHSVEIWQGDALVGGLYGLAFGQLFFGESMFSRQPNTSKLALVFLVKQLRQWNYQLIDCQVTTGHLATLGAREISRREFQRYLYKYLNLNGMSGHWQPSLTDNQLRDEL